MRILVTEDNHETAANLGDFLEYFGHHVDFAYNGASAIELLAQSRFDLVILDVMMPIMDGIQACDAIRQGTHADVPIIFVTARDTLEDKLAGFNAGADDYIVKPFEMAELHARIQALEARNKRRHSPNLSFGPFIYNCESDEVSIDGQELNLDPTQKRIVKLLLTRAPKLVSSEDIAYELWRGEEPEESSALRTQIYRLRKALPKDLLVTERGKGYRLNDI